MHPSSNWILGGCEHLHPLPAHRASFPEGAFQTFLIGSEQVRSIIDDKRVKAATLTGSGPAGNQVAIEAGENIKKTVLELGGSDPFIVMLSADLDVAISTVVTARTLTHRQTHL